MGKGYTIRKKGGGELSDPMKELIKKLKIDPSQLDSSGMGKHWKVENMKIKPKKKKKKTA
tara:strand:- start:102 stop:281 length:180 start_codon:yes stop_codon:yes gene_type:complete